ncbi:hypothetical protein EBU91_04265, partial [bacterium]|nr:hypothetical protein [bacterium]
WNGGPNAGHTVYLDGKKYKTHLIPSGVFHGKKSIIGPNCVLNVNKLRRCPEKARSRLRFQKPALLQSCDHFVKSRACNTYKIRYIVFGIGTPSDQLHTRVCTTVKRIRTKRVFIACYTHAFTGVFIYACT